LSTDEESLKATHEPSADSLSKEKMKLKRCLWRMNERHLFSFLSQTEQAEALVVTDMAALTLSMRVQAATP
jgi:hypothetical protein